MTTADDRTMTTNRGPSMTNPMSSDATTGNPRATALRRLPGVLLPLMCGALMVACSAGQGS